MPLFTIFYGQLSKVCTVAAKMAPCTGVIQVTMHRRKKMTDTYFIEMFVFTDFFTLDRSMDGVYSNIDFESFSRDESHYGQGRSIDGEIWYEKGFILSCL